MSAETYKWHNKVINKCGVPACAKLKEKGAYCVYHHDVVYEERAAINKRPHDYTPRYTFDHWCKGNYY